MSERKCPNCGGPLYGNDPGVPAGSGMDDRCWHLHRVDNRWTVAAVVSGTPPPEEQT